MSVKSFDKSFDLIIVILFYISITTTLYFSSLSQSMGGEGTSVPMYILLFPFGVSFLQLFRVFMLLGRSKMGPLAKSWLRIFIYYAIALVYGLATNQNVNNYYVMWFIICPTSAWFYYSAVVIINPSLKETLIKISFWALVVFVGISLYFIPRSVRSNGLFSSLNTSYYALLAYPMVMMNTSKVKRVLATLLMVIVVLLSMKRGGIVSIALAFVIYLLFATNLGVFKKVMVVAVSIGALFYLIPKVDEMTNGTLTTRYEFSQGGGDEEGRATMYKVVWNAFGSSGLMEQIFGHGLNAVVNNKVLSGDAAHNDYLEFIYDYGIIGLILLLLYQWQLLLITYRSLKGKRYFLSTILAFTSTIVLSMVSIVYAFYYFLIIIPFWCVVNQVQIEERKKVSL